jgi:ferredoxin/flavodoxin---NADP+ reductase
LVKFAILKTVLPVDPERKLCLMSKIIEKEFLSQNVARLVIEAPLIARKRKAGHFVIIKIGEKGERIPLTISSADPVKGTITLIVQRVGVTSHKLVNLNAGDELTDVVGPLGQHTHIEKVGTVLCAGGGVGIAPLLPIVEEMKKAGNRIVTVLAARSKEYLILEKEMVPHSDKIIVMTDDGSYGQKGLVTQGMEEIIRSEKVDMAIAIGPAVMMKFASMLTKKYNIPTVASLNTIMVDGTGMCGACRLTVGGETKFVCVDGPEFDAHQVDFDELIIRLNAYKDEEASAYASYDGRV